MKITASRRVVEVGALFLVLCVPGRAQTTTRVSVDSLGAQANSASSNATVSADGRFVTFESLATNLVAGDTNGWPDAFVRDRLTGTTERISIDSAGAQGNGWSAFPSLSVDGRYVVFQSLATNLVAGDTNGQLDVFLRDRLLGTTERVSLGSAGAQGDGHSHSHRLSISGDGRYVVFRSLATNLVAGDTNGQVDVFVRDRVSGTTERVSVGPAGAQADDRSDYHSISVDGRYVAFESLGSNLVAGDTNAKRDIFVRDRFAGTTERISVDTAGAQANEASRYPSISADGRYVAFQSTASNLVAGDTSIWEDVFVRDRVSATTERVSVDSAGTPGDVHSNLPSISDDGRYVAFQSYASNLVAGDTNAAEDVFIRDRIAGTTERVSADSAGAQGNGNSETASISGSGRYVSFVSAASNLVPGDGNTFDDVFLRDRLGGTSFTSLCDPGAGGVIPCPCANPPSGAGRGCDNSSATGGAVLSASGSSTLSSDSLVFSASGETPTAPSIVVQGNTAIPSGVVYGQGVRCAGGTLKRLYTKSASGGSVTAPDFGAGEPQVSVRSVALGDPILAGQSRWYLVYYRDSIVLGGCLPSHSFNATQTGQVTWSP